MDEDTFHIPKTRGSVYAMLMLVSIKLRSHINRMLFVWRPNISSAQDQHVTRNAWILTTAFRRIVEYSHALAEMSGRKKVKFINPDAISLLYISVISATCYYSSNIFRVVFCEDHSAHTASPLKNNRLRAVNARSQYVWTNVILGKHKSSRWEHFIENRAWLCENVGTATYILDLGNRWKWKVSFVNGTFYSTCLSPVREVILYV
jgi:hypothetical protein